MKKILALAISASILGAAPLMAQGEATPKKEQSESASSVLYDFKDYGALEVIKYFKELNDKGQMFPTADEFKNKFGVNVELMRSHVRKAQLVKGQDKQLNPNLREGRTVFMNLPTGTEKGTGGFPSGQFDNDPYTLWQYTDLWGAWNHGFFQAPGSWAAAAHKHGVDMMSGITFFDTTGNPGGESSAKYETAILVKENGEFIYVKPLIHALMYLGLDGINYNWESGGYTGADVVAFHKALRNYADEIGFDNYRQAIYTSRSYLRDDHQFVNAWLWDKDKKHNIGDIMLNYAASDFDVRNTKQSADIAKEVTGSYDHLYQGAWIVSMNRSFAEMENKNTNLCLWGEHDKSRFIFYNTGNSATAKMANLQVLFERAFSGGSRNPAITDDWGTGDWGAQLADFGGISRMIPERTTFQQETPFRTFFNTGAGERYFYKGKSASKGGWYDMGAQDLQPTYRWAQYAKGTTNATKPVQVKYTYEDAYTGGSALHFEGAGEVDIVLYRGQLTIGSTNPVAKLAFKTVERGVKTNGLELLLRKEGSTDYIVVPFAELKGNEWEEQSVKINGLKKGDKVDQIAVRLNGKTNLYLGELAIFDDRTDDAPYLPFNLKAEVKEETQKSLSAMLSWEVKAKGATDRGRFGLIYNDEAGVDHFEILYKEGENGKVRELARTSSWMTYVPKVEFDKLAKEGANTVYFGVRSVAKDLKTASKVSWIAVKRANSANVPKIDRYAKAYLGPRDKEKAHRFRFLEKVKITDKTSGDVLMDYNSPEKKKNTNPEDNYVYFEDGNLTVEQGQTIKLYFKGAIVGNHLNSASEDDGMRYCFGRTFIDWDDNGVFDAEGDENIKQLQLGTARKSTKALQTGYTAEFQIPVDARRGKVRVRVVFGDAWAPVPSPSGALDKGCAFDFDMTITGDKPERESKDPRDQGAPEEVKVVNATDAEIKAAPVVTLDSELPKFYPNPATSVVNFENTDMAWIFSLQGQLMMVVKEGTVDVSALPAGTYIVKAERNNVTRSYKLIKK